MFDAFYQQGNSEQVCEMLMILIILDRGRMAAVAAREGLCSLRLTYHMLCLAASPARGPLAPDGPSAVGARDTSRNPSAAGD